MNISFNNDTREISIDCFKTSPFNEHYGLEILAKINRAIYEFENLQDKNNDIAITMDSYEGTICYAILNSKKMQFFYGNEHMLILAKEIKMIKIKIITFLNEHYGFYYVNYESIDPMFLEQVLGVDLPFLISVQIKNIYLNELKNFSEEDKNGVPLKSGRYFKQITSNSYINYPRHINNLYNESNEDRIKKVLKAMKDNSYAKNGSMIILYNDSLVIRDGEHRAAALYYLYGNIEIPVLVLSFLENFYSYKLYYQRNIV